MALREHDSRRASSHEPAVTTPDAQATTSRRRHNGPLPEVQRCWPDADDRDDPVDRRRDQPSSGLPPSPQRSPDAGSRSSDPATPSPELHWPRRSTPRARCDPPPQVIARLGKLGETYPFQAARHEQRVQCPFAPAHTCAQLARSKIHGTGNGRVDTPVTFAADSWAATGSPSGPSGTPVVFLHWVV